MVPSVSIAEGERMGGAERKGAFLQAGRGLLPKRLISISAPSLSSPLSPLSQYLLSGAERERVTLRAAFSHQHQTSHMPHPLDPAPFVMALAKAVYSIPKLAKGTMGKRCRTAKEGMGRRCSHVHHKRS